MEYYTAAEIINSVFASVLFGISVGIVRALLIVAFASVKILLLSFKNARCDQRGLKGIACFRENDDFTFAPRKIVLFLSDFAVTLIFGVGFSILSYITVDGVVRLYMLITALGAYILGYRILNKYLLPVLIRIFSFICRIISYLTVFLMLPPMKLFHYLKEHIFKMIFITARTRFLDIARRFRKDRSHKDKIGHKSY